MYRGTWINDEQLEGMFIDREKRQWKGNFLTGEVYLVKDGTNETEVKRDD